MSIKSLIHKALALLPDKVYLTLLYRYNTGKWIDWRNPQTFTEKIQWLKLYDRRKEYTAMADKILAKEFACERIGQNAIIPTIGTWDTPDEIDFEKLPNRFVLKTNHGGGNNGVIIVKDKSNVDFNEIRNKLRQALKADIYTGYREWPYKNINRRILAEPYMEIRGKDELTDYKFFCFNGKPLYCQVIADRRKGETIDFFDTEWNHMEFYGLNPTVKQAITPPAKPSNFELMLDYAAKLSEGIPFLRVDLYDINDRVYFGETTFYPASGLGRFTPDQWNLKLGNLIILPINSNA